MDILDSALPTGTAFETTCGYELQLPYVWCTAGIHVLPLEVHVRASEVVSKEYLSIFL